MTVMVNKGIFFLASVQFLQQMGSDADSVKKGSFFTGALDLAHEGEYRIVHIKTNIMQ